ncbi:MAG: F0F1 ATP synthase subunit delta [bacterium]|nr:F0F1 ATP synthase subunit delta [bacterium]
MAELTTVARPYAKAAFEFARDAGKLADWSAMLGLAAGIASDAEFALYLARPTLTSEQQAEAFSKVVGDKLDGEGRNFISNLIAHKRIDALPAIAELYEAFRAELEQSADVQVTSAFELDAAQRLSLSALLGKKLGRKIAIDEVTVDRSLIGGVVIRSGDLVIDASVRGKLGKLSATLNS